MSTTCFRSMSDGFNFKWGAATPARNHRGLLVSCDKAAAPRHFPSVKHLANSRDAFCKHTPAIFGLGKLPNGCLDAHIAKML